MKTIVPHLRNYSTCLFLICCIFISAITNGQTYKSVAHGNWSNPSTWNNGIVPPATIPQGAEVHINHEVIYNLGSAISNQGAFLIFPASSAKAKLAVPSGINFDNESTGYFYINAGSYVQYRFIGGGNSGVSQSGTFKNKGGVIYIYNSYLEVAQDWVSENGGRRTISGGCLLTGQNFSISGTDSRDTLINTNISIGWQGSGNFELSGGRINFQNTKINLANNGNFALSSGIAVGNINLVTFKHPITGTISTGNLFISPSVNTNPGLSLGYYCISNPGNFITNGKLSNTPGVDCSGSSNFITCTQPIGNITLPVELISFAATLHSNKVSLNWITAAEINVSHFVIEKSIDGRNYAEAGLVFARGNSTALTHYHFSDDLANTTSAVVYYRLRSVDIDAKIQYSQVRVIRIAKGTERYITILAYPNPVQNELRITIPATWQNKYVTYEIFSANGQAVRKDQTIHSSQTETINVSTLARGYYILKATCGAELSQQRIIKQ